MMLFGLILFFGSMFVNVTIYRVTRLPINDPKQLRFFVPFLLSIFTGAAGAMIFMNEVLK